MSVIASEVVPSGTELPAAPAPGFDGDAMLMYGWVADCALRVRWLNHSLRNKLERLGCTAPEQVERGGVPLTDFLSSILEPGNFPQAESGDRAELLKFGDELQGALRALVEAVEHPDGREAPEEVRFHDCGIIPVITRPEDKSWVIAGVRAVKPDGFLLRSRDPRDRVDLVIVCCVAREEDGWRVTGFQGQLQDAWLRLEFVIREGTKSGSVALMGRNMSHNIGSHVLFWLEQDESQLADAARAVDEAGGDGKREHFHEERARFYKYLRERMELMAGFATGVALPATSEWLKDLVEGFQAQQVLHRRLGRSEQVEVVEVGYPQVKGEDLPPGQNGDFKVAVPGGIVGIQAFYSLLENIIRDSAKYGTKPELLAIRVRAEKVPSDSDGGYIRVTVTDNQGTFEPARKTIRKVLDGLKIVDEAGRLELEGWGTKERIIAAAYLRGMRLEDVCLGGRGKDEAPELILGKAAPDELKLLDIDHDGEGNLSWVFYLPLARDILVVQDGPDEGAERPDDAVVTVRDHNWLRTAVRQPASMPHRFVVIHPGDDFRWLSEHTAALPIGTYVALEEDANVPESLRPFTPLREFPTPLQAIPKALLHTAWLRHLQAAGEARPLQFPTIVVQHGDYFQFRIEPDARGVVVQRRGLTAALDTGQERPERERDEIMDEILASGAPVIFLDGHGVQPFYASHVLHYERHDNGTACRALAEALVGMDSDDPRLLEMCLEVVAASFTKLLIVDERLDVRADRQRDKSKAWSLKELCAFKGIAIRGEEYAGKAITEETLLDWVREPRRLWSDFYLEAPPTKKFDILCLHRGITDKLESRCGVELEELCEKLAAHVRFIVLHSGRMDIANLPDTCRFLPLSNVTEWVTGQRDKLGVVRELLQLRRPLHGDTVHRREHETAEV